MTSPSPRRPARLLSAALLTATTTALVVLGAGQAQATVLSRGANQAAADERCAAAYDGEADGNGVYADVVLADDRHFSVWDGNGSDGNWGPASCFDAQIARFRVCEDHSGCADWFWWPKP
ncbi:hypothetical protein ABZ816_24570 [Actinosynnema sp. NPDC047251]|uniref:Putative secreted protein n=1 Tax=Saccharothrix espanaensis (strain ATCC 51144 / DSM 44229 / JCM 9112 / NBRC 15066 / NRRL 15764) TaxID=1179773 RepID=K0K424_SACES|nr:hypothetical protein [Saccharothrix espanaensis]CCH32347.1 putative secreted protein [Saccharothrix espanaensis DSM 44229]